MIDAQIPLEVRPPAAQPSALQTIGGIAALRDTVSQIALRNQQTQQAQAQAADLQAQAKQRDTDLQDQKTAQDWLKDPANAYSFGQGKLEGLLGKVQTKTYQALQTAATDSIIKHQGIDKSNLEMYQAHQSGIEKGLIGLDTLPDDAARAAAWPELKNQWQQAGYLKDVPPGTVPDSISGSPDQIKLMAAQLNVMKGITDAALARKKETAATDKDVAETNLKNAQVPGEQAKSTVEQAQSQLTLDAIQKARANPGAGGEVIRSILNPSIDPNGQAANAYIKDWQSKMDRGKLDEADKVISQAAAHAATLAQSLNPAVHAEKVKEAVDANNAKIPGEISKAVQTQVALAKNSPDAFAGIIDPRTRTAAETQYQKDSQEYAQKVAAARQLQDYVAAAQSGNKAAPALIPIEELRGLVNRVNRNELQSVSGAGSIVDKVQGWVNGHTHGEPIPPDVLKDIGSLANVTEQAARRAYEYNVQVNNQTHGGKVQPITLNTPQSPTASAPIVQHSPSTGAYRYSLDGGQTWLPGQPPK